MILVTGGTGFFGRHLVRALVAGGQEVRVLSRVPGRVELPGGVAWARGDLTDAASLRVALDGVDTVVHAGAVLRDGADADLERVNASGTERLARAAREGSVSHFIHVSSAGVYGDGTTVEPHAESDVPCPRTPYERSKLLAERALLDVLAGSDMKWTILRPQGLYGADRPATASLFREAARRRLWLHGPARVLVHPTYVLDLVAAVGLVIERPQSRGEVINVGGERPLEYRELIALIAARMGRAPWQLAAPGWVVPVASIAARAWRAPPALLDRLSRGLINRSVSIEKARRILGFSPVSLEWGIDSTAQALAGRAPS